MADAAGVVQYARNDGVHLAYQVMGSGSRDVLLLPGGTMPMDSLDHHPKGSAWIRTLQGLGRLILMDQRGIGQSDSVDEPITPDDEGEDLAAVLEAVDATDCLVVSAFDSSFAAIVAAARQPTRIGSLALINGFARFHSRLAAPEHLSPDVLRAFQSILDAEETGGDVVLFVAPSERDDASWRAWFDAAGRRGASPRAAAARWEMHERADVTDRLEAVAVPTLVIHRAGNLIVSPQQASVLASRIPQARLVSVEGHDNMIYAGDVDQLLDLVIEFAGGAAEERRVTRSLAAVLFTDIVASTQHAITLGDRRWATALDIHDSVANRVLARHRGRLVKATGDGLLVTFASPEAAVRCAAQLRDELKGMGVQIRSGVHVGEIEMRGGDVAGVAVHVAARVMAKAEAGEVLVSSAVPILMVGSPITFADRGVHELKGIPGVWPMFAAQV